MSFSVITSGETEVVDSGIIMPFISKIKSNPTVSFHPTAGPINGYQINPKIEPIIIKVQSKDQYLFSLIFKFTETDDNNNIGWDSNGVDETTQLFNIRYPKSNDQIIGTTFPFEVASNDKGDKYYIQFLAQFFTNLHFIYSVVFTYTVLHERGPK